MRYRRPGPRVDDDPVSDCLKRPLFGLHRVEWPDTEAVEFHLSHGDWIRVLRANGFQIENLIEVRPPENTGRRHPHASMEWVRNWPCEEIWVVRKATT